MSITKPYTFTAGTKARANEVNADFDTLYSQVNINITDIAQNKLDIEDLESTKAEINGNATQRFSVADAVNSSDAVNQKTLKKAINNSINFIYGYTITKDTNSPNNTILVSAGSCYDSTKSVVLASEVVQSKQNASQSASTTYYVYVIGDDSGNQIDILISTLSVTPNLPSGYTLFRQIGKYTTDTNGVISTIYSDSNTSVQSKTFVPLTLSVGVGTTSLTSYLPTDNYQYLVFLYVDYGTWGTACWINSDICQSFCIAHTDHDAGRATNAGGQGIIPVGTGRTITCQGTGATIRGYMRI